MDLRHPFLTEQLIAYIGNKRALLPFLHGVFSRLVPEPSRATFLDPFAGSGAVSRLAKMMGFAVGANDLEMYSYVINSCHLGVGKEDLAGLFRENGGLSAVLSELNTLPPVSEDKAYIGRHYAPRSTTNADWRTERLFYTRENAQAIDAMRERIEEMYAGVPADPTAFQEKMTLLAPLLYEAATHTNTSGVFKACHRGFGGHGRDALKRIMAGIELRAPVLIEASAPASVACMDALDFLSKRRADICYLDPPYAVHQYGSNYFMLNSIALWDKPPVSDERGPDGRLRSKAGIRRDWTRTRSEFCSPATAVDAMRRTIQAADCRWLVVSYSDEGVIDLEELCDLLAATGSLSLQSTGYVKYPGGKQSLGRTTRTLEVALVVDRNARRSGGRTRATQPVAELMRELRVARLMGRVFDPSRVRAAFHVEPGAIIVGTSYGHSVRLPMRHHWKFAPDALPPRFVAPAEAEQFIADLCGCVVKDVREEIDVLIDIARTEPDPREKAKLQREILRLANKLAHRKYRELFREALATLRAYSSGEPGLEGFRAGLDAIAQTAARRSGETILH
jgi:adenine-specific DNA-methyltransferase